MNIFKRQARDQGHHDGLYGDARDPNKVMSQHRSSYLTGHTEGSRKRSSMTPEERRRADV